jgi:hypothetical protein
MTAAPSRDEWSRIAIPLSRVVVSASQSGALMPASDMASPADRKLACSA